MLTTLMMTIVGGEATEDVEDEAGDGQVFARYDRRLGSCEEALDRRIHQRLRRIHGKSKEMWQRLSLHTSVGQPAGLCQEHIQLLVDSRD